MTDAISALLEVLAAHRFDAYRDKDWAPVPCHHSIELVRWIIPDVTAEDFEENGELVYVRLTPAAIERARKALEKV